MPEDVSDSLSNEVCSAVSPLVELVGTSHEPDVECDGFGLDADQHTDGATEVLSQELVDPFSPWRRHVVDDKVVIDVLVPHDFDASGSAHDFTHLLDEGAWSFAQNDML